jgi:hypothetical protein
VLLGYQNRRTAIYPCIRVYALYKLPNVLRIAVVTAGEDFLRKAIKFVAVSAAREYVAGSDMDNRGGSD